MKSPRPLSSSLKWSMRTVGALLIGGSLGMLVLYLVSMRLTLHLPSWLATLAGGKGDTTMLVIERLAAELLLMLLGLWLWLRAAVSAPAAGVPTLVEADGAIAAAARPRPSLRAEPRRWNACNVLRVGADTRQVWQFDARGGSFALTRDQSVRAGEPLPAGLGAKSWSSLWQKKMNVAWLPPEDVFIRVAQFPQSSPEETLSMVELQLEKLSPIPVTQAVWSLHMLPHSGANMQTVAVIIVARSAVEEFLGNLEGQGYLADRLELPLLDQLEASTITGDGAWIYPETRSGASTALVAWWCGGALQNVDLLTLPPAATRATGLRDQLMQMAWAGELEGWLTSPPRWHLVAEDAAAAEWVGPLREGLEQLIDVIPPLSHQELAARTARRAVQANPAVNLLPAEFAERYRQQFLERLWMRGLGFGLLLYVVGLIIYFVAVAVMSYQTTGAEAKVADRAQAFTNAVQLKAQYLILKERQELKYAALNCWEAVAETLPENVTLDSMIFSGEWRKLSLVGTAPTSQFNDVLNFSDKLRKFLDPSSSSGQPLFDLNGIDPPRSQVVNPTTVRWNYDLLLKRTESP